MSFAINPSLNHIDVPESCVYEFYRSAAEILLPDARFHGHTCEAYICIAKNEKAVRAYVALLETGMKTVFVYTSDLSISEPAKYPEVYAEAEAFLKAMGFAMEPVNLDFSPAMREVIIKGFRVMRPPPPKKQPLRQMRSMATPTPTPEPEPSKLKVEATATPPSPVFAATESDEATEVESLQRELSSAKAALAQMTRDKVLLEQNASQKIASLKASCEQAMEAKRKAVDVAEKLSQEKSSGTDRHDDGEKKALRDELQAVVKAAKDSEVLLQEQINSLQQKLGLLENEKLDLEEQLATACDAMASQERAHAEENDTLLSRLADDEKAAIAAADRLASLGQIETAWKEGQQREEDLCRNIDLMHNQLDTLAMELDSCKEKSAAAEELQQKVNGLEQELAAAKEELEIAASRENIPEHVTAELNSLREEKLAVEAEYVRLANESREKELEMLDAVAAAEEEIERLTSEMEIQKQVTSMEHEALRAELRKQVVASVTSGTTGAAAATARPSSRPASRATAPTEASQVQAVQVQAAPTEVAATVLSTPVVAPTLAESTAATITAAVPPAVVTPLQAEPSPPPAHVESEPVTLDETDDEPDRPIVTDRAIVSRLINEFGGFNGSNSSETTEFSIDPSLTAIDYSNPEEIEVLLYSINSVQAVPDSSSIQRCKGYVVATKKEGDYKVYVAWYLTESKRVVICTPQQQPADSEECISVLQDAVAYFEIVGFMMEVAELGESLSSYKKALGKAPVFSRTSP